MKTNYTTTRQEAADELGVSSQTISNWLDRRVLVKAKISDPKKTYVTRASVEALKANLSDITGQKEVIEKLRKELHDERECLEDEVRSIVHRHSIIAPYYDTFIDMAEYMVKKFYGDDFNNRRADIVKSVLDGETLSEISDRLNLTPERVRQIANKEWNRINEHIETYRNAIEEKKRLEEENARLKEYIKQHDIRIDKEKEMADVLAIRLEDFNLSVRTLNCCKCADLETVGDLTRIRKKDLLSIRNVGKKSVAELDDILESLDLDWGMNINVKSLL